MSFIYVYIYPFLSPPPPPPSPFLPCSRTRGARAICRCRAYECVQVSLFVHPRATPPARAAVAARGMCQQPAPTRQSAVVVVVERWAGGLWWWYKMRARSMRAGVTGGVGSCSM